LGPQGTSTPIPTPELDILAVHQLLSAFEPTAIDQAPTIAVARCLSRYSRSARLLTATTLRFNANIRLPLPLLHVEADVLDAIPRRDIAKHKRSLDDYGKSGSEYVGSEDDPLVFDDIRP